MTWSLSAHGEAQDEDAEIELQLRLNQLLADPKFGTAGSQLATRRHNGPVHLTVKKTPGTKGTIQKGG
jgi:hypothetical protein